MIDHPALLPLASVPPDDVERLLDLAFGPDRHRRTAYRIRAGTHPIDALSLAAVNNDGRLVGSVQCWPVTFVADAGPSVPMILVGPVAVDPKAQRAGLGRRLMSAALARTEQPGIAGADALMLIGDPEYYARFFGFSAAATGGWRLPGPVEAHRLLARGPAVPDGSGTVVARVAGACSPPPLT